MSIVVVATAFPLPEHRDEVVAAFVDAIGDVHANDAGCELYALHEGADRVVMVEKWTSAEALATHSKGAALQKFGPRLAGKIIGEVDVQVLQPHPAGTAEQGTL
jgi:quinol monooxygenase YgiN